VLAANTGVDDQGHRSTSAQPVDPACHHRDLRGAAEQSGLDDTRRHVVFERRQLLMLLGSEAALIRLVPQRGGQRRAFEQRMRPARPAAR